MWISATRLWLTTLAETQSAYDGRYEQWRGTAYFGGIGPSVPIYLATGNHEEEEGWNFDDTPSRALLNIEARKRYFPMPNDDGFYSASTEIHAGLSGDQLREDYYAWEWGDALFVVIDPFQHTMTMPYSAIAGEESDETVDADQWHWTLGDDQYNWLKNTLENSNAKYKFVFSHNMVGGVITPGVSGGPGYVRGGAGGAPYFEWGGYNADGSWGFADKRPGWDKPIHQLFVENGVSAYFHGHDHQYVYETRDGVVYQEVPSPSMTGSGFPGIYTEGDFTDFYGDYSTVEMLPGAGHLRISVTPTEATVDYIAASGGGVNYAYTIEPNEAEPPTGEVTVDGDVSSGTANEVATISFAHTTGAGADRLLLVGVSWNSGSAEREITSVTFNDGGTDYPLSEVFNQQGDSQPRNAAIYSLLAPPSGTAGTVTVTFDGSVSNGIVAGAANFAGVNQTDPFGTANGATGSSTTASVTLSGLNGDELVFDTVFQGASNESQTLTEGADQTGQWTDFAGNTRAAASVEEATGDSVTMSWTAASSSVWAIGAVPINPAPGGDDETPPVISLLGDAEMTLYQGTAFTDPGATASDNVDGDITAAIEVGGDVVDTGTLGDYVVTYDVEDAAGNPAVQVTRTVHVVEAPPIFLDGDVSSATGDGVASISFAHTTGTGANRLLLVGISVNNYSTEPTIDAVTFNYDAIESALSLVGSVNYEGRYVAIYGLVNPPSGQIGTVEVNFSEAVGYGLLVGATNFSGVDQATPWGTFASASAQSDTPSVELTGLGGNEVVFDTVFIGAATIPAVTVGADQSELWNLSGNRAGGMASIEAATGSSVTMSWSTGGTSVYWAIGAVPINPASSGDDVTPPVISLLGDAEMTLYQGTAFTDPGATASDNVDGDITAAIVVGGEVDTDTLGDYVVTYDVEDAAGNPAVQVTRTVHVVEAPPIFLDGDVSSATGDGVASISFAHTTGTGANRLLLVGISVNNYSTEPTIDAVTFNYDAIESALSLVGSVNYEGRYVAIYGLVNPPSGQIGTVEVNFSEAVGYGLLVGATNFSGVDQATPWGTFASASAQSDTPSVELTGLGGNEVVFDTVFIGAAEIPAVTVGADQSELWNLSGNRAGGMASIEAATGSSVTMSWSTGGTSVYWAIGAVPINPASSGVDGTPPVISLLGDAEMTLYQGTAFTDPGATASDNVDGDITAAIVVGGEVDTDTLGDYVVTYDVEDAAGNPAVQVTRTVHVVEAPPIFLDGDVSSATGDGVASISFAHTTGTGANRLLLVGVSWNCGTTNRTISDVIFIPSGGDDIDLDPVILQPGANSSGDPRYSAIYSLIDPPSGVSGTVSVTFSGSVSNGIVAGAANFAGVNQTTPLGTPGGAQATSSSDATVTLSGLNGDELIFDTLFQGGADEGQTVTAGANQIQQWTGFAGNTRGAASIEEATGGSVTMSWTAASESVYAIAAVPIIPASSAPLVPSHSIVLGRPTDNSITVNAIVDQVGEVAFEYGTTSTSHGSYDAQTSVLPAAAGEPVEVLIDSLTGDTQYFYRMLFRATSGAAWSVGPEHSFHTQRAAGDGFVFTVISDSHLGDTFSGNDPDRYEQTTLNVAADHPDFHLDLGDTFVMNSPTNQDEANAIYLAQRPYFGNFSHSAPVFLAIGNHENEEGWNLDDTPFSKALASINARRAYFLNPITDGFYSGNDDPLPPEYGGGFREDYYAWEWGDALFIVLDPFQYTMTKPYTADPFNEDETETGDQWEWTLGLEQFQWFKDTLEGSDAKFKFVFAHHMVGGIPYVSVGGADAGYVRGGGEAASYFEWGGQNEDGTPGFGDERPEADWGSDPIHQLMVANGVKAFFHGHDHQFVHEERDGIVYQLVPSASMANGDYGFDLYDDSPYVVSGGNLPNAGHLRVTVGGDQATIEYVRSAISGDTGVTNGEISHTFTILADSDNDGVPDAVENASGCMNPYDADTDDDGIPDGAEDANRDGVLDTDETNPCDADTDGDGILDGTESGLIAANVGPDTNLSVFVPDLDPSTTTNPLLADTDDDGILDGLEDINLNGRVDAGESDPNIFNNVSQGKGLPWLPLLLLE